MHLRWHLLVPVFLLLSGCDFLAVQKDNLAVQKDNNACSSFAKAYQPFAARFTSSNVAYDKTSLTTAWSATQCAREKLQLLTAAEQTKWDYIDERVSEFPLVGYKVALGNTRAQALFALPEPVIGVLFNDTLLNNGAVIYRSAGLNLAYEPDLIAVVKSADINTATTIEEVAPHIDQLVAFLEVPDLLTKLEPAAGFAFVASNAAVRWGVVGDSIIARSDQAFVDSLASMQVITIDAHGAQLSSAKGSSVMGHPYNAIVFLLEKLKQNNRTLKAGDSISLGAFAKPKPLASDSNRNNANVDANTNRITVNYSGIDGVAMFSVTANFVD